MSGALTDDTHMATVQVDMAAKIAVIEDKVFGENGLIKEVKEIKNKIDRFTFLWVGGCFAVASSFTAAVLSHTI